MRFLQSQNFIYLAVWAWRATIASFAFHRSGMNNEQTFPAGHFSLNRINIILYYLFFDNYLILKLKFNLFMQTKV